jgi:hypothetical protein
LALNGLAIVVFTRRQKELESMAFIDAKERLEYLNLVPKKLERMEQLQLKTSSTDKEDASEDIFSGGNKRMRVFEEAN